MKKLKSNRKICFIFEKDEQYIVAAEKGAELNMNLHDCVCLFKNLANSIMESTGNLTKREISIVLHDCIDEAMHDSLANINTEKSSGMITDMIERVFTDEGGKDESGEQPGNS